MTKMAFFALALILMTSATVANQDFAIIIGGPFDCKLNSTVLRNEENAYISDEGINIIVKLELTEPNELPLHYLSSKVIVNLNELHLFYLQATYELLRHDAYLEKYSSYFQKLFKQIADLRHRLSTFIQEKEVTHGKYRAVFDHSCIMTTVGYGNALTPDSLVHKFDSSSSSLGNKLYGLFSQAIKINNDITFKLVRVLRLIGSNEALEDEQMVEFISRDLLPEFSKMKKDLVSQQHLVGLDINSSSHIVFLNLMMD